jgi:copper oxidase (laccase) domain-containing protein
VADCVPVYLAAPAVRAVGLLHAGWRGSAAGILERGVRLLTSRAGCTPGDIVMHCGVGICGDCYEVGPEVLEGFGLRGDGRGPWRLDLRERLTDQGAALGIREISSSSWCSAHHRPLFYSHRASGGSDGRMVAYIGIPRVS